MSQLIEFPIIPELRGWDIEAAYQQMAEDKTREAEALEWADALIGEPETEVEV